MLFTKSKSKRGKAADASKMVTLKMSVPDATFRPLPYTEHKPFIDFKEQLDGHIEALFRNEVDDGNGNTFDNWIYDMAMQAEKALERERVEHRDNIKMYAVKRENYRKAFVCELSQLNVMLDESMQELSELKIRMKNNKFIGGTKNA